MRRASDSGAGGRPRRGALAAAVCAALVLAATVPGLSDGDEGPAAGSGEGTQAPATTTAPTATAPSPASLTPPSAAGEAPAPAAEPAPQGPAAVRLAIDTRDARAPVARRFLGLSFELSSLAQVAGWSERGNLVRLLRSLGPGVLRFGGVSADTRVAWTDAATPPPAWASETVGEADLVALDRLARRSGWRVLLTIGMAHYEPQAAAREAAAAKRVLGAQLAGIELGNEPDSYARHGLRTLPWTFAQYDVQAAAYRAAIARAAPGVRLAGPDVSGSHAFTRWGSGEARRLRPALLTGHHYPLGCRQVTAASAAQLLSGSVRWQEDVSLQRFMAIARASGIGFRLDEANTVSCGGVAGVSDTFASSLWAVSYLTRAMGAGVAGINLHGNPANCRGYTPLCAPTPQGLATGELRAQPEWYALLLVRHLVGSRPLPTVAAGASAANVGATAFRAPDGSLQVAIVDEAPAGSAPATVSIPAGARHGTVGAIRLTAPSPQALAGVALTGERLSGGAQLTVSVAPASAVLVTVAPPPRRAHPRHG